MRGRGGSIQPGTARGSISQTSSPCYGAQMKVQDALLVGRMTFESFRGYWRKQTDDSTGITDHLNTEQVRRV